LKKVEGAIKDVFRSIDWLKVAKRAGGLALTAFTGVPTPEQIGSIINSCKVWLKIPSNL
jgi:hypothetical protein